MIASLKTNSHSHLMGYRNQNRSYGNSYTAQNLNPLLATVVLNVYAIAKLFPTKITTIWYLEYSQSEYSNLIGERLVSISRRTQVRQ